jgi:hypothetical protein
MDLSPQQTAQILAQREERKIRDAGGRPFAIGRNGVTFSK